MQKDGRNRLDSPGQTVRCVLAILVRCLVWVWRHYGGPTRPRGARRDCSKNSEGSTVRHEARTVKYRSSSETNVEGMEKAYKFKVRDNHCSLFLRRNKGMQPQCSTTKD